MENSRLASFQSYLKNNKSFNKLFGIGANKTGTTTLNTVAKKIYGFRSAQRPGVASIHQIIKGNFSSIKDHIDSNDFHQDVPLSIGSIYIALDCLYPGSKFILTLRESESWYSSFFNFYYHKTIKPFLYPEFKRASHPIFPGHDLIWFTYAYKSELSHISHIAADQFKDDEHLIEAIRDTTFKSSCISNYNNRINSIQNYFSNRPEDLLQIKISDPNLYSKINTFFGLPSDAVSYITPVKNSHNKSKRNTDAPSFQKSISVNILF